MALMLEELDGSTRGHMESAFTSEWNSAQPYVPQSLTSLGLAEWPSLMLSTIRDGDDETLGRALRERPGLLNQTQMYVRNGLLRERAVNVDQASAQLAASEFNTWYVRGLSARLLAEDVEHVEIYRAAQPKWEPGGCSEHEGMVVPTQDVYDGHRATYWPSTRPDAFSVPFQPGCHHSIRRLES